MNCDEAKRHLSLLLYDELSFEDEEEIRQHLEGCEACRAELAREKAMHEALNQQETDPPVSLLAECRRDLRSSLQAAGSTKGFFANLFPIFRPGLPRLAGALALALAAIGFFAARLIPLGEAPAKVDEASLAGPVVTQVRRLQPGPSGEVRIVLDETRQRVLSGSLKDEAIRRVLLDAARESSNPGLRAESMDLLRTETQSADVRQALLDALEHDPNPGVRLRAIDGLRTFASAPGIRPVLTKVLMADENPGVRTEAIDLLMQHKGAGIAGVLQELLQTEDNNYVRLRCQKALREMNASVETF